MHTERKPVFLRNGNPQGNPMNAPRCGARTRHGSSCRAPAMANGRCRMHGGKSTGPRTPEGLERSRKANWKHGLYSAESVAARRYMSQLLRDSREMIEHVEKDMKVGLSLGISQGRLLREGFSCDTPQAGIVDLRCPNPPKTGHFGTFCRLTEPAKRIGEKSHSGPLTLKIRNSAASMSWNCVNEFLYQSRADFPKTAGASPRFAGCTTDTDHVNASSPKFG